MLARYSGRGEAVDGRIRHVPLGDGQRLAVDLAHGDPRQEIPLIVGVLVEFLAPPIAVDVDQVAVGQGGQRVDRVPPPEIGRRDRGLHAELSQVVDHRPVERVLGLGEVELAGPGHPGLEDAVGGQIILPGEFGVILRPERVVEGVLLVRQHRMLPPWFVRSFSLVIRTPDDRRIILVTQRGVAIDVAQVVVAGGPSSGPATGCCSS